MKGILFMGIKKEVFKIKHTADCRRVRPTRAITNVKKLSELASVGRTRLRHAA